MFYRTNKIIVAGFRLLILALTANAASGQYCIGDTRYMVRDENGKTTRNNSWRKSNAGDDRLPDIENAVGAIDQKLLIKWKKTKR